MKALFAHAGLPQGRYRVLRGRDPAEEALILEAFGLPVFVKPANLGSSVAVTKVKHAADLGSALDLAFAYDRKALVEAAIEAREIEVSVLGNDQPEASLPGEIVPDREFYDYASKYSAESRTRLLIPAPLDAAAVTDVRRLGLAAFRAVDASGYARVDCFLDRRTGQVLLNEINTIPGFTSISMFPKMWEATGLAYADLLSRLLDLARERGEGEGGEDREGGGTPPPRGEPFPPYLQALALCWRIEQPPETTARDASFRERVSQALALADRALGRDPHDLRARLARGAAHGVLGRYFLFRDQRREAAREAVRMREDLVLAREGGASESDLWFGLGLYDYYTDVLPRLFRLLRFFAGMPGATARGGLPRSSSHARDRCSTRWRPGYSSTRSTPSWRGARPGRWKSCACSRRDTPAGRAGA